MVHAFIFLFCVFSASSALSLPFGSRIELSRINDEKLFEISGIAHGISNKDILWIHNDSGNESIIYGINKQAEIKCEIYLNNVKFIDAEDIAIGIGSEPDKHYIYLADIGDNGSIRKEIYIYRFEEPMLSDVDTISKIIIDDYDILTCTYPDIPKDAETLMIDPIDRKIIIVSKRETNVKVYSTSIPDKGNHNIELDYITTLPYGHEGFPSSGVVAGDIAFDGGEILIKSYSKVYWYIRKTNQTLADALQSQPLILDYMPEPQGEAICFDADNVGFYTISEAGPLNLTPSLYFYPRLSSDIDKGMNYLINNDNERLWISDTKIYNIKGIPVADYKDYNNLDTGLYFITYLSNNSVLTKKMLLIK